MGPIPATGNSFELWRVAGLVLAVLVLGGCAASRTVQYETVEMQRAETEVPVEALLDVGILLFDPGVPEGQEEPEGFVFPEVRRAEARYMPYHLKSTLEASGYWGSVWVLPERSDAVDLIVWARIDESDGLNVKLRAAAWDATGREWFNKEYDTVVPEKAYSTFRDRSQDPYQNIYNAIANDLLAERRKLDAKQLAEIRRVAELRFANDLVPAAFSRYIEKDEDRYEIRRLPADDDPMLARMRAVREREYMLVDTLNEYYASLYYELSQPYEDWRRMSRTEMIQYRELRRSARMRQLLGIAAILGAVAYEAKGGGNSAITTTAVFGGIEGIKSGLGKAAEADIHRESLGELGRSFESEAEPVVVEVEGQTRRLTGTAEEKYREWRRLLHELYASETGLLSLNDAPGEPDQVAPETR
ncbi:MAG TPA: hypothetical protein ENK16_03470 [Chromatiales bacterium]|nr:hypothetical protein [Chromatiales bacterium]